jgi:hypothetical protein
MSAQAIFAVVRGYAHELRAGAAAQDAGISSNR